MISLHACVYTQSLHLNCTRVHMYVGMYTYSRSITNCYRYPIFFFLAILFKFNELQQKKIYAYKNVKKN